MPNKVSRLAANLQELIELKNVGLIRYVQLHQPEITTEFTEWSFDKEGIQLGEHFLDLSQLFSYELMLDIITLYFIDPNV